MNFVIIFEYRTGKLERENKTFENWDSAEHWAEKEMVSRGCKTYWIQ